MIFDPRALNKQGPWTKDCSILEYCSKEHHMFTKQFIYRHCEKRGGQFRYVNTYWTPDSLISAFCPWCNTQQEALDLAYPYAGTTPSELYEVVESEASSKVRAA